MPEFYNYGARFIMLCFVLSIACVISQSLDVMFSLLRHSEDSEKKAENLTEILMLVYCFILGTLIGDVKTNFDESIIVPDHFIVARYVLWACSIASNLFEFYKNKKIYKFLPAAMATVFLPNVEMLLYRHNIFTPVSFVTVLVFFLRSVLISHIRHCYIKRNISVFSVKEAIDALHTGIMFSDEKGRVLLINNRMVKLLYKVTGRLYRNGKSCTPHALDYVQKNTVKTVVLSGRKMFHDDDGKWWMFGESNIECDKKRYVQITAADVTSHMNMTMELKKQNDELLKHGEEIKKRIENLQTIRRNDELIKMKTSVHDIMGQRITLLLRMLRNESKLDKTVLEPLSGDIMRIIKKEVNSYSAEKKFLQLKRTFKEIGVSISMEGEFPKEKNTAVFFGDFVRECVTNSVRHGFANSITVRSTQDTDGIRLEVCDNGIAGETVIAEGGGIRGIRHRLEGFNGTLSIETKPNFKITAFIPF